MLSTALQRIGRDRALAFLAGLTAALMPVGLVAQPMPTLSAGLGINAYEHAPSLVAGLVLEVSAGAEWVGRSRIEIGANVASGSRQCTGGRCTPWTAETIGLFGEFARILGDRDDAARFILAARGGFEQLKSRDRFGISGAFRAGTELRLGAKTAFLAMGSVGWVDFGSPGIFPTTDVTGMRLGVRLGLRVYPDG